MAAEYVVLLDDHGRVSRTLPKSEAHHASTALHLASSCDVVDRTGRVLVSQRSSDKKIWPLPGPVHTALADQADLAIERAT